MSTSCGRRSQDRAIDYPVAVDNDYAVWRAFANHYWPALYFVDARRHHPPPPLRRGALRGVGAGDPAPARHRRPLVSVEGLGVEAEADWDHLRTPETYLGYGRGERFARRRAAFDEPRTYALPERCRSTTGRSPATGRSGASTSCSTAAGGSIAFRFHARDAHLVLSAGAGEPIPFRVLLDGEAPGRSHGVDVDEDGNGVLRDGRLYQLVRAARRGPRADARDHVPRAGGRGVRLHVRVGAP